MMLLKELLETADEEQWINVFAQEGKTSWGIGDRPKPLLEMMRPVLGKRVVNLIASDDYLQVYICMEEDEE